MPFDEKLASRVRNAFAQRGTPAEERRMMGGLCFMVNAKMCVGIVGNRLMVRMDPVSYEDALKLPGCFPMDFTGRPMKGFVFVEGKAIATEKLLGNWIDKALEFNPRAKAASKKQATHAKNQGSQRKPNR